MLPIYHIIFSIIIALIIFSINPSLLFILLFLTGAIFIDIDHYFLYIIKKKDFNFFKAYKYFRHQLRKEKLRKFEKPKKLLFIFHTIEFFIFLLILAFFLSFFWPFLLGCLFHETIDLINDSFKQNRKYIKAYSLIFYIIKN